VVLTVAVVLGGGVLLGTAAVVVDVGRLYAEREQLQSGADAGAWAVAEACVLDPAGCADQGALADDYADRTAADGAAEVTAVCGTGPGLPACPPPAGNRTDCLGVPPAGPYVEVRTATELADGSSLLPPAFARAVAGDEYAGSQVAACARAAWGPPRRAAGLALTFSVCEWNNLTDGGTTVWPADEVPPPSAERVVFLKDNTTATCGAGPAGWDAPGGFGWLDDPDSTCTTTVEADGTYGGNTGNSLSQPCRTEMDELWAGRGATVIPVYDGIQEQGAGTEYHLAGFAAFVVTGYDLSGAGRTSWLSGRNRCGDSGSLRCVYGYFSRALVADVGGIAEGPDLGVAVVSMVG
jgi:hypothetical protein